MFSFPILFQTWKWRKSNNILPCIPYLWVLCCGSMVILQPDGTHEVETVVIIWGELSHSLPCVRVFTVYLDVWAPTAVYEERPNSYKTNVCLKQATFYQAFTEQQCHINLPQKVRKSNFGPLYLPFNNTKWYCIIYHFYHWFVAFTMRYIM